MSDGPSFLPSFAAGGVPDLSPDLLAYLQGQAQPQGAGGQSVTLPQISVDVPQAVAPGFSGYDPQTPPTGAPTPVVQPQAQGLALAAMGALGPSSAQAAEMSDRDALIASARRIGANPLDYATVMSYETGGTFSPSKWGGSGGRHMGLIQFGPVEREKYGASPNQTFQEQLPAVERYLTARGFKPGMDRLDLYSTINAGRPGLYNASDAGNGGAPGSVLDKVRDQMGSHETKARAFLGGDFSPMAQRTPGTAAPNAASMGSTAQAGAFGLSGVAGRGAPVPGQSSPTPGLASLSGQPLTAGALPGGLSTDAAGAGQPAATSPYSGLLGQLQGVAGSLGKGGQQQGQRGQGGGMSMGGGDGGGRPIGLQQAKALFDPSRFFQTLRAHGVNPLGR